MNRDTDDGVRPRRRPAAIATLLGNSAAVVITIAQAFLLVPLCLAFIGPLTYGAWLAATELLIWVQFLDGGIPNLLTQRVAAATGRGDRVEAARWSATGLAVLTAIAAGLIVIGIGVAPYVTRWARVPASEAAMFTGAFRVGLIASALLLVSNGVTGLSRGLQQTVLINATNVIGAFTGLIVSTVLLLLGWGVWGLAFGLLCRGVVTATGSVVFLHRAPGSLARWVLRPSRSIATEIRGLAPSMTGASIGYLLANNSEILLVTTAFGPIAAVTYALTRRVVDGLRNLLDSVVWAVSGGFAHLATADDRHRARPVLRQILWLRLAAASLTGAVAIAINEPFVTLLFGAEHFGGIGLTVAFVAQLICGGQSFLLNFLFRSAGAVREGSLLLAGEAVVRVIAMSAGLALFGLVGAPAAAVIVSVAFWHVTTRRLDVSLPPTLTGIAGPRYVAWATPAIVFALGTAVGVVGICPNWIHIGMMAAAVAAAGGALLWQVRPDSYFPQR